MQINKNLKSGFTLVEIMIVVAIIGLLAAIAIPNFVRARTTAQQNACINNLRQIDSANGPGEIRHRSVPGSVGQRLERPLPRRRHHGDLYQQLHHQIGV